jgi:hypothetical protein
MNMRSHIIKITGILVFAYLAVGSNTTGGGGGGGMGREGMICNQTPGGLYCKNPNDVWEKNTVICSPTPGGMYCRNPNR